MVNDTQLQAGAEWGWQITPYGGYAIGGNFQDNATGDNPDVKEGGSFGLVPGQLLPMAGITFSL